MTLRIGSLAIAVAICLAGCGGGGGGGGGLGTDPPGGGNPGGTTDTTPPAVTISQPASGNVSGMTTITAIATDNVGVAGVQFKLNGTNISAEDTSSPYSVQWNAATASAGEHQITAVARDAAGNTMTSPVVNVTVQASGGDTQPPMISITQPANGDTVNGTRTIAVTATDNVGVVGVRFTIDGTAFGEEDTTAPFVSMSWDTAAVTNGIHTLSATARDAAGLTSTETITVTVNHSGTVSGGSWCNPATWGGAVPTATSDVTISNAVVLDCNADVRSLTILAGGKLTASRSQSSTLTLHGNLVVRGLLDYGTPADRIANGVVAEIVFQGMEDRNYVGTPSEFSCVANDLNDCERGPPQDTSMTVVNSDVGLWVVDDGVFTGAGQLKKAWSKLMEGTAAGDATFTVADATGWRAGDRVMLTPSAMIAVANYAKQFDEREIASVSGNTVTLTQAPTYAHAGCTDCMRRSEAANLSRNVIVRSFDSTNHAHIMVANRGLVQLDSVELRWLGPSHDCTRGELPMRRAAIYFHQQRDASDPSFIRHAAIWGGKREFFHAETSNGIEVTDVAGYDGQGDGFVRDFDYSACGLRCMEPADGLGVLRRNNFSQVLAAKVAVPNRPEGCLAVGRARGITAGGGDTLDSVATGIAYNFHEFGNEAAITWPEEKAGHSPIDLFNGNVAHNNAGNGISNWQNNTRNDTPFADNQSWSNGSNGFLHGAYGNSVQYVNLTAVDNGYRSFGIKSTMLSDRKRIDGGLVDDVGPILYTFVPNFPVTMSNLEFTGDRTHAFTQVHDLCVGGNENDPNDGTCIRAWLRLENPRIPAGTVPFDFGDHVNKFSLWEVRGFSHPDYPTLPQNFDLYRRDNQVPGGNYHPAFDAWLVPR
ncbi:MAG TPA: Ig-like domain-containing protein [Steroidobacter sp.]|uniref:Ig-like domain-containing protein n=1 Tax=Steroidobacter sp. TaxID=1978227 RepID=UPI002ED98218